MKSLLRLTLPAVFTLLACPPAEPEKDTTAPTIARTVPGRDAIGVATNAKLTIELSEAMDPASINTETVRLVRGAQSVMRAVTYDAQRNVIEVAPSGPLAENAQYSATVTTGVKDVAGNALAADYEWKFTTVGAAPVVASTTPADGATGVARNAVVRFQFDKAVDPTTLQANLLLTGAGGTPIAATHTYDAPTLTATLTPSAALPEGAVVTATAKAAIKGTNGLTMAGDRVVSFTVVSDPPTVSTTVPVDMAQSVALDTPITAQLSEPIDEQTLTTSSFFLREGTNMLSAMVSLSTDRLTATLAPTSPLLEGRSYAVTLTTAVKDDFGNAMAAAKTWTFQTLATVPTITSVMPVDMATDVAGNTPVVVTFSEAMDPTTFTAATFEVRSGTTPIMGTRTYDAPSRTVTFQPTGAYPGGSTISVRLTTGIKDTSGIALGAERQLSFSISNAPSVVSSVPMPNTANVALNGAVSLTFTMPMDVSTLTNANVWLERGAGNKVAAAYSTTSTTVTMTPSAALMESSEYAVVVTTGVRSATNVAFAAQYRFTFNTLGVPPQVATTQPVAGAKDVSTASTVTVEFNEPMDQASLDGGALVVSDGANPVAGALSVIDARTVRFTPAARLRGSHEFTATVTTGAKDVAGNALAAPHHFSFTTEALPRIESIEPRHGATGVPLNARLVVAFSKDIASMIKVTAVAASTTEAITITNPAGARVDGAVTYSAATHTATIRPQSAGADVPWAASSRYVVSIDGSKLLDASGNPIGGSWLHTFVTGAASDTTAPTLVTSHPLNGATGVDRSASLWAELSEPLSAASVTPMTVRVLDGSAPLPGTVSYEPATKRVHFKPSVPLPPDKALTFEIGAVTDLVGNAKAATNSIGLTTADNPAPTLLGSAPADGATGVNVNTSIRLALSERIDAQSLSVSASTMAGALAGQTIYDAASATVLFDPEGNIPANAMVTVTIAPGLKDLEGQATSQPITVTFGTVNDAAQDVTAPTVTSSTPAHQAMGVAAQPVITVTFSEALDPDVLAQGTYTLRERGGPQVLHQASMSPGGEVLTLRPLDALRGGVTYDLALTAQITDLSGNALAPRTLSFTVENVRPTITATSPVASSTVGNGTQVSLTFSEPLDPATISPATVAMSRGTNAVLAALSYDAASRTAVLQPASTLADGVHTVTVQAAQVKDLAGNALVASTGMVYSFTFTVSSAGPSVAQTSLCGTQIDADDLASQVATFTFDRPVRRAGGVALDGTALKLQRMGADVPATVTHTADTATATLTPSAALLPGETYTLIATTLVLATNNSAPMASQHACTFTTQKVVFKDAVDDASTTGYTITVPAGHAWARLNSTDDTRNSVAWRGGNSSDGQSYVRECRGALAGAAPDRVVTLEKQIDLTGFSSAEVRFLVMDDIQRTGAADEARLIVNDGSDHVLRTWTGQNAANDYVREGKSTGNLTPYVNRTVRLRWELVIRGHNVGALQNCNNNNIAGRKGLFVDDILIVAQ